MTIALEDVYCLILKDEAKIERQAPDYFILEYRATKYHLEKRSYKIDGREIYWDEKHTSIAYDYLG